MKELGIHGKQLIPTLTAIFALAGTGYFVAPMAMEKAFNLNAGPAPGTQPIKGYNDIVDPKTSEAFTDRGAARSFVGDTRGAIKDFDEAIKLDPKNARAYFGRGQCYIDLEKFVEAHNDLNLAVQYNPNEATYYLARGRSHLYQKGDLNREACLADYNRGIELDPKNAELLCARAYIRGLLKDPRGSIEDLNAAEKIDPYDAWIPFERGNQRALLGDKKGAFEDFHVALTLFPDYPNVYLSRGLLRSESPLPEERKLAMKDFETAVKIASDDDPWPLQVRAGELEKVGDKKAAEEDRAKAKVIEKKLELREKKIKKKRYELIENPIIYKFANDTLDKAQKTFGKAKVPVNRLYIFYRTGKSCQTLMVDEKRGIFAICMANDDTADIYYHSLVHEIIHLLNTRLADPYIEGICCAFAEHVTPPPRRKLKVMTRQYTHGVVRIPFYSVAYIMIKELESKLKLEGIADILKYRAWHKKSKVWQHVDVDKWLSSLPEDKRILARDIINKHADKIEKDMPDDDAYAFARPSDRGDSQKKWLENESQVQPPAADKPSPDRDRSSKTDEPRLDSIGNGDQLPKETLQ